MKEEEINLQIDKLLCELDRIARQDNQYDNGLPINNRDLYLSMKIAVVQTITKIIEVNKMQELKYCKDCKYAEINIFSFIFNYEFIKCSYIKDMVTGKGKYYCSTMKDCGLCRNDNIKNHFEPRRIKK
jgi:hypothetical protein